MWLNPRHGKALLTLIFDLCWASGWTGDANQWIGPVLSLPPLQFVDFSDNLMRERPDGVHCKSPTTSRSPPSTPPRRCPTMSTHASACGRTDSPP